jgi:hypothetical protein
VERASRELVTGPGVVATGNGDLVSANAGDDDLGSAAAVRVLRQRATAVRGWSSAGRLRGLAERGRRGVMA